VLGETTRRTASPVMLAGLRASDYDRMLEAFALAYQAVGGPDRNGWLAAMADDVADVLACAGLR
jgi:hypothetical protein